MQIRKSQLRKVIQEQVGTFFVCPQPLGTVGRTKNLESSLGNEFNESDVNKNALKDVIRQIVVDIEKSSHKRMMGEISGVDSLKPNDPHTPEDEAEKDAADDVMEADPKAKKGGRPRGGPHIENVRFWDLPESSLRYIIKDASQAMNANPMARKALKWADEVNDAVTVLYWRKKKGITVDEGKKDKIKKRPWVDGLDPAGGIGETKEMKVKDKKGFIMDGVGSLASTPKSKALVKKMYDMVSRKLKLKSIEDVQPVKDGIAFIFGDPADAKKMAGHLKKAGSLGKVMKLAAGGGNRTMVSLRTQLLT